MERKRLDMINFVIKKYEYSLIRIRLSLSVRGKRQDHKQASKIRDQVLGGARKILLYFVLPQIRICANFFCFVLIILIYLL